MEKPELHQLLRHLQSRIETLEQEKEEREKNFREREKMITEKEKTIAEIAKMKEEAMDKQEEYLKESLAINEEENWKIELQSLKESRARLNEEIKQLEMQNQNLARFTEQKKEENKKMEMQTQKISESRSTSGWFADWASEKAKEVARAFFSVVVDKTISSFHASASPSIVTLSRVSHPYPMISCDSHPIATRILSQNDPTKFDYYLKMNMLAEMNE